MYRPFFGPILKNNNTNINNNNNNNNNCEDDTNLYKVKYK